MSEKIRYEGGGTVWDYEKDAPLVRFVNGAAEVDQATAKRLDELGYKRAGQGAEQPQKTVESLGLGDTGQSFIDDSGSVELSSDLGEPLPFADHSHNDSDELSDPGQNKRGRKPKHD